jgi:hypothetical protein
MDGILRIPRKPFETTIPKQKLEKNFNNSTGIRKSEFSDSSRIAVWVKFPKWLEYSKERYTKPSGNTDACKK